MSNNENGQNQYKANENAVQNAIVNAEGINENIQDAIGQKNLNLIEKNKINLEQKKKQFMIKINYLLHVSECFKLVEIKMLIN